MGNDEWPQEYQVGLNDAVSLCQTSGVEPALASLKSLEERFRSHPAFEGRFEELQQSILRNVVLVLTLSDEIRAKLALQNLEEENSSLRIFSAEEQQTLRRAIAGKLSSTAWT